MFRMLGKKVELIRYKVTWQEDEQEMREVGGGYRCPADSRRLCRCNCVA